MTEEEIDKYFENEDNIPPLTPEQLKQWEEESEELAEWVRITLPLPLPDSMQRDMEIEYFDYQNYLNWLWLNDRPQYDWEII